ncbi:LppP/LprE family lipoprotein [Mycolicibacterium sp. XJ879]
MRRPAATSLTCAVLWTGVAVSGTAIAAPPSECGVNLSAPQVIAATAQLPPYPGTGWRWSTDPRTMEGNFSPCATLSTALVTVEGATGGSPVTALMFHKGTYIGKATSEAYSYTSLNAAQTTDDTVVLSYKTPGQCNACPPAAINNVRYRWQGDHVAMLDAPPPKW